MKRTVAIGFAGLLVAALFPALARSQDQPVDTFTIPAGSTLHLRLMVTLSSKATQNGDPWTGSVMEPIFSHGLEVIPYGSVVEGRVTYVKEPGRAKGVAEMRLVADTIYTPHDGPRYQIVASLQDAQGAEGAKVKGSEGTVQGPGKSAKDAAKDAGIGAAVGAGVGGIARGGTGALYGAGIGAVTGIVRAIAKHHKDVTLPQGTELTFEIARETTAKKIPPPAAQPSTPSQ